MNVPSNRQDKKNVTLTRPAALAPKPARTPVLSGSHLVTFLGVLSVLALLWGVTSYFLSAPKAPLPFSSSDPAIRGRAKFASVEKVEELAKSMPEKERPSKKEKEEGEALYDDVDSSGIALAVESEATEVKDPDLLRLAKKKKEAAKKERIAKAETKKTPAPKLKDEIKKRAEPKKQPAPFETQAFAKAKELEKAGDWKGALSQYNGVLYRDAKNSRALDGKIHALEEVASEGAIDVLDNLISLYPKKAALYAAKARVLLKFNDDMEAKKLMEKALTLAPENKAYAKELKAM